MKVYIAGPMRGYEKFNFPAFFAAEERLKEWRLIIDRGNGDEEEPLFSEVFNPARADNERYGTDVSAGDGNEETAAAQFGFSLREALERDMVWIARNADAIYMLSGWEKSSGARAEHALAIALGLKILYEEGI